MSRRIDRAVNLTHRKKRNMKAKRVKRATQLFLFSDGMNVLFLFSSGGLVSKRTPPPYDAFCGLYEVRMCFIYKNFFLKNCHAHTQKLVSHG